MDFIYVDPLSQKEYPQWMVSAVDQLLKKVAEKDIWEIVDFSLSFWAKKNPIEYRNYLASLEKYRKSRKNKYASTTEKQMRELVYIPNDVSYLLEKIAAHRIDDYGRLKFMKEFARRYPGFRAGEVL